MQNAIVGVVVGIVVGSVVGVSILAPRLSNPEAPLPPEVERLAPPESVFASQAGDNGSHLDMVSAYPANLPQIGTLAKRLESEIARISGGNLILRFHEPDTLAPTGELFQAVASGALDAAFASPGLWREHVPALQLFEAVPFGPSASEYLAWIYFGGGRELLDEIYAEHGIRSLVCGLATPEATGWFRHPIHSVADLDGLRMRVSGLGAKVLARLGVETRDIADGDLFVALESGELDAVEYSIPAIDLRLGFHEQARHYYFPGWHQPATLFDLIINAELWESLSTPARAQIEAACGDNIRHGLAEGEAAQFEALKALHAEGVQIHRLPDTVVNALEIAWHEVAAEEARQNEQFAEVWRSLSDFRRDYAIWQEIGHP